MERFPVSLGLISDNYLINMQKGYVKIVLIFLILVIAIGAYVFLKGGDKQASSLLSEDIIVYVYAVDGSPMGGGIVSIPFSGATEDKFFINVLLDLNKDGSLDTKTEWVVKNQNASIFKDYRNNFTLDLAGIALSDGETMISRAVLSGGAMSADWDGNVKEATSSIETNAKVSIYELSDILGLSVPGASEELKRGPSGVFEAFKTQEVFAQGSVAVTTASRGGTTPDIRQGNMECTPTAATNNLISLANEHGAGDRLPQNPSDLINELKNDMNFNNGVLLRNIVAGKDAFAARYNLPIVTERIDNPTIQDVVDALANGSAVEMSMSMVQSASGHASTGHVVSVVGATSSGGSQQVQVHDPASPTGMGTIDVTSEIRTPSGKRFEGINYPMWDGITFIDAIFVQTWTEPEHATTGTSVGGGISLSKIETLVIGGSYYPKSQFHVGSSPRDKCKAPHYHADGTVYGLQNQTSTTIVNTTDPKPTSCGFGKVSDIPIRDIEITFEQSTELMRVIP